MRRSRLSQMLIYWHINSAFRKARALPERKTSNFETGSNKVNFLKNLKRGELIKQIKAAQVFCLPSSVEGFGIATIEAAAAGLPYIVSDIEIFKEVTKNGQGGLLFKLDDIEDLSKKLEKFISDKNFYKQKSDEARKLSLFYDWSKIADQTEAVYKNLVK